MSATLTTPSGPIIQVWAVEGRRALPDGGESRVLGTSFGSTEERAREHWVKVWGKGLEWPVSELTFTPEGAGTKLELRHAGWGTGAVATALPSPP